MAERVARAKKKLTAQAKKARTTTPKQKPATPSAQPAGPDAFGSVGSVKKGAATWNQDGMTASLKDSGVSWFYNWAPDPQDVKAPAGVDFVPMIWGADAVNASTLATAKKHGNTLLGFNEPDLAEQSNLSVERALELWPQLEGTGLRLGSPAVAWGADQDGQWLEKFMQGAEDKNYRVDFITLHWYGSDFNPKNATQHLKTYVEATHAKYGKPIWLTEYSLMNFGGGPKFASPADQAEFVRLSTKMLEELDYVERYSWFAFPTSKNGQDETGLYRPGGALTEPGKAYRAAG
nr:glycoside hydrolase family protein [Kineosporia babensis]